MPKNKQKILTKEDILLKSEKLARREKRIKVLKISLLIMALFLIALYFVLKIVYETGEFTITLDPNFAQKQRTYNVREKR